MPLKPAPYGSGVALFLNSTLTSYHWGCYGTSAAIRTRLEAAGYLVESFPVEVTHALPYPEPVPPIDFHAYDAALREQALALYVAINDADIVVVNGEGTIHRGHPGPCALLGLIAYIRRVGKPVHLINHSCFPNGDEQPAAPELEAYYRYCLADVDTVVVREPASLEVYGRLGIEAALGFDSLPLFIRDHVDVVAREPGDRILVSVCNILDDAGAVEIGRAVQAQHGGRPVAFLGGGYKRQPLEDARHYEALASAIEDLELLAPTSLQDWAQAIADARLMVTGRYHHMIAGLCVGTPMVLMPANTPKISAVAATLGMDVAPPGGPELETRIAAALARPAIREARLESLATLAERNFDFLA